MNMMDPAIQAEIARQVFLALHQEREERYYASAVKEKPAKGARLNQISRRRLNFFSPAGPKSSWSAFSGTPEKLSYRHRL